MITKRIMAAIMSFIIITAYFTPVYANDEQGWDGSSTAVPEYIDNVYTISKPEELAWLGGQISGGNSFRGYEINLVSDIDLNNKNWTPMGKNLNNYFAGTFNGNGHTIKNASIIFSIDSANIINAPYHTAGFFGVCNGATIQDVKISNFNISIKNESGYTQSYASIDGTSVFAGGICGYGINTVFKNNTVSDCTISAYTGSESASAYAGGICGYAKDSCQFGYCKVEGGSISGTSTSLNNDCYAGGIAGALIDEGLIYQSCNSASVKGGHEIAAAYTGGLVGESMGTSDTLSAIRDSYNCGNVSHKGSWMETGAVGGIIGQSMSTVTRCYNSGNINADTSTFFGDVYCSGIVGGASSSATVKNCAVMSASISGGTSNYVISSGGVKQDNISTGSISGASNDANIKYTSTQLETSEPYVSMGWDFDKIWQTQEGGYPILREAVSDTDNIVNIVNEAVDAVSIIFAEGDNYDTVKNNVLYTGSPNEAQVVWSSSNEAVVSSQTGAVNRNAKDTKVMIRAEVSYKGYTVTKTFLLNVLGIEASEAVESADWGMSVDDARRFVSYVRGVKLKDIPVEDYAVQVLIGKDTDEEHISEFMAEAMHFWEIPGESQYLKSKMGNVIDLMKKGEDEVISDFVVDCLKDALTLAPDTDVTSPGKIIIAKKCGRIALCMYNVQKEIKDAYSSYKNIYEMKDIPINSIQDHLYVAFSQASILGNIFDAMDPEGDGNASDVIEDTNSALSLMALCGAYKIEEQNTIRNYIKLYIDNRKQFTSPDDENFRTIMSGISLSNMKDIINDKSGTGIENIDTLAETLYQIQQKFCKGLDEEYKVLIQCPVDVYVYDSQGILVGRVIDNKVDTSISNSVVITLGGEENDEKTVYLDNAEKYLIQLKGNAVGSMNVSVTENDGSASRTDSYKDIPLTEGKEMIMDIDFTSLSSEASDIVSVENGIVTEEIKSADSEEKSYALNLYSCVENSVGELIFSGNAGDIQSGMYAEGTELSTLVQANKGYEFEGFYTDPDCTAIYEYDTMPAEELTLFAKFRDDGTVPNNTDAVMLLKYISGVDIQNEALRFKDYNADGSEDLKDVINILQNALKY